MAKTIKLLLGPAKLFSKLCLIICLYFSAKTIEFWYANSVNELETLLRFNTISSTQCGCQKIISSDTMLKQQAIPNFSSFQWCSTESSLRGKHQRVIVLSLFGEVHNDGFFQRYYSILTHIALIAEEKYPGWILRIYHDIELLQTPNDTNFNINSSERLASARDILCDVYCRYHNVDLCNINWLKERHRSTINHGKIKELKLSIAATAIDSSIINGVNPRMYRFLVLLDANVDVFISRDADSIITSREVEAVKQWLSSNYTFHVMRDHQLHYAVMLAGNCSNIISHCTFS